jgi:CRP-like cAMP-binding protein
MAAGGSAARLRGPDSAITRAILIAAQLLTLVALALGLLFVVRTTGGTLFAFSAVAPLLVLTSLAALAAVALHQYRRSHSLFDLITCAPGTVIVREGDPGDCAYFIRSGEVEVVRSVDGREVPVARLGAGQFFGEMALLTDQPRNATVRALAASELALLGKQNFLSLMAVLPATEHDILTTVQRHAMAVRDRRATMRRHAGT